MSTQKISVLPSLLRRLRTDKQLSQKTLALAAHIDQSRLCAIEKGRASAADGDLVERLANALKLTNSERRSLQWAKEHDRLMDELERTSLARARDAVSQLLSATEFLTDEELSGLAEEIRSVSDSKRRVQSLTRSSPRQSSSLTGGSAMT